MTVAETGRTPLPAYVAGRRPALVRMAAGITGNAAVAEDLVQTTLVAVMPRWEAIRDGAAEDAYVHRAMVNRHRSWCRTPAGRREELVGELPEVPAVEGPDPAVAADERARLWALVLQLPSRQRAALVLRYYEGLSEAETARALGVTVGTVKSNTSRAVAALRSRVAAGAAA